MIKNKEAKEPVYNGYNLSEFTKNGQLERLRPGLYQLTGEVIDDFILILPNKNLRRLIKYSKLFKIKDEVRKYVEVL